MRMERPSALWGFMWFPKKTTPITDVTAPLNDPAAPRAPRVTSRGQAHGGQRRRGAARPPPPLVLSGHAASLNPY